MSSILKVDTIQDQSGNNIINENADTITIGASGDTITIPSGATIDTSGATLTLPTTIEVDTIEPQSGTSLTLGASGDTITIPSGATITNSGTATGFGNLLQIQKQTSTSELGCTSATYTPFSGLAVTLTALSTNSKFFCLLNAVRCFNGAGENNDYTFTDGTNLSSFQRFYSGYGGTGSAINPGLTGIIYGTHAAGDSVTITPQFKTSGGTFVIGDTGATSTFYVMEIA